MRPHVRPHVNRNGVFIILNQLVDHCASLKLKVDSATIMLLAGRDLRERQQRDDWLSSG